MLEQAIVKACQIGDIFDNVTALYLQTSEPESTQGTNTWVNPSHFKTPFALHCVCVCVCVCVLVTQSCPTPCNPMDCSLPGSSVYGILQARILKWGAILFSMGSSRPRDWTQVSCIAGRFFTFWATRESKLEDCNVAEDCDVWCIRTDDNNGKCLGLFILENGFWQLTSFLWFPWLQ